MITQSLFTIFRLFVAWMTALADATIDYMIKDPANADKHCIATFEAFWRMIA
jgi:hypothetical protein